MRLLILGLITIFMSSMSLTSGKSMIQSKPATTPATKCAVAAYVIDQDPKGLNVRSGPGSKFPVIAKLPTKTKEGDDEMVEVWVTGISDGWAMFEAAATTNTELKLYAGNGWVFAQMLGVDAADRANAGLAVNFYRQPMENSSVVGEVSQQTTMKLIGCRGEWAQVEYQGLKGWLPRALREQYVVKPANKK